MKTIIISAFLLLSGNYLHSQFTNSLFVIDSLALELNEKNLSLLTANTWKPIDFYRIEFGDTINSNRLEILPNLKFNENFTYHLTIGDLTYFHCIGKWKIASHNKLKLYHSDYLEKAEKVNYCNEKFWEYRFPERNAYFVIYKISANHLTLARIARSDGALAYFYHYQKTSPKTVR